MNTFLEGFILGAAAGPLFVFGLYRLSRISFIKRQLLRVRRVFGGLYWRGIETLLNRLDNMLARKREREAGELSSPNLASRTGRGVKTYTSSPPVK
jgi:hypothetical protein